MASEASPSEDRNAERRRRVFLGALPADFLRVTTDNQLQESADRQAALALHQQQLAAGSALANNPIGRLNVTIVEAKLVKNYGLPRMDPYVRLRVGHCVYETSTAINAGKTPRWNKVVQCLLPQGINTISLQIFDECSFTVDELIAWAEIPIPEAVFQGKTIEDWYPLSGKQGENSEGMVSLVLSFTNALNTVYSGFPTAPPVMVVPTPTVFGRTRNYQSIPVYTTQSQAAHPAEVPATYQQLTEEELNQISEMFPNMDKEVIKSVAEANRGNKDATVNSLLGMMD